MSLRRFSDGCRAAALAAGGLRAATLAASLLAVSRPGFAQCPDGTPPPCAAPRAPSRAAATAPDPSRIAILPFRATGASPQLAYLKDGMVEMLASEFTGEVGPRAVDPGSVFRAWARAGGEHAHLDEAAALRVARDLGAGRAVLGAVIGSDARMTITASVVSVPGGEVLVRPIRVDGTSDGLPASMARLATRLLSGAAGGSEGTVTADPGTQSTDALRAYLTGLSAYRRARYDEAGAAFARALAADSGFVQAAYVQVIVSGWSASAVPDVERIRSLAWSSRERLAMRERSLLTAILGPRYPAPSPLSETITARERAVELLPDNTDAWYLLGDAYFHFGAYLGVADWHERATSGFQRALALDSSFGGPLSHLLQLAFWRGDSAAARRAAASYFAGNPVGTFADFSRWFVLARRGDPRSAGEAMHFLDTTNAGEASFIAQAVQFEQLDGAYVHRALANLRRGTAATRAMRFDALEGEAITVLNLGLPSQAARSLRELDELDESGWSALAALYGDGDDTLAEGWAGRVTQRVDGPVPEDAGSRARWYALTCALEEWRLVRGRTGGAPQTIERLKAAAQPADEGPVVARAHLCASVLEALLAERTRSAGAVEAVNRLDSIMRTGPGPILRRLPRENLALARLLVARGDTARALGAVRRATPYYGSAVFLPARLRLEGALARAAGDREGAVRAYRHYLYLRADPEPELVPQRDSVRAELARVEGRP